jgi:methyl-accepting chemotaxis protein
VSERQENLRGVVGEASSDLAGPALAEHLAGLDKISGDYDLIEVTDLTGRVLASSRPEGSFDPSGEPWFRAAASGQTVVTSPVDAGGDMRWVIAVAVIDPGGHPVGVVVGDLDENQLSDLLDPELTGRGAKVVAVDKDRRLVYDTAMGAVDGTAMLAKGALKTRVDNPGVTAALAGRSGSAQFRQDGRDLVVGYDSVDEPRWAILVEQPSSIVLKPVASQRRAAALFVAAAALLAAGLALLFARRETRFLIGLADESNAASGDVSSAAAELLASSEELAATTTEQSAAVTEVSATTEELARASGSIADTVDEVAAQSGQTRDNLEQAEADIVASSERTLALAERVGQIGAILTLINEIADQTNLLALNAAIEAARAGDSGRGFAVVADEVRRLAERSKGSAAEIATIVEGTHAETTATVMAMEKGAAQMQRGLRLLEGVTEATAQVRLTTQQQHSATGQVVETMEQLTDASRQVSATAQQIEAAAALLADLSANLQATAESAKNRY